MVRNFLSSDGLYIFSILYSSERNIKVQAEQIKMQKMLNIEFTDLLSMEPVDSSYRPLRLSNRLWKPLEYENSSEYFNYLRPKLCELINDINFKKMAKEVNI